MNLFSRSSFTEAVFAHTKLKLTSVFNTRCKLNHSSNKQDTKSIGSTINILKVNITFIINVVNIQQYKVHYESKCKSFIF